MNLSNEASRFIESDAQMQKGLRLLSASDQELVLPMLKMAFSAEKCAGIRESTSVALEAIDRAVAAAAGGAEMAQARQPLTAGPAEAPCALKRESEVLDGALREVR